MTFTSIVASENMRNECLLIFFNIRDLDLLKHDW